MTLEELKNKVMMYAGFIHDMHADETDKDKALRGQFAEGILSDITGEYAEKILTNQDDYTKLEDMLEELGFDHKKVMDELYKSVFESQLLESRLGKNRNKLENIRAISKMDMNSAFKMNAIMDLFEDKADFHKLMGSMGFTFKTLITEKFSLNDLSSAEKNLNALHKLSGEYIPDEITTRDYFEQGLEMDSNPQKAIIEELKANASVEDIKILDEADKLLKEGDKELSMKTNGFVENATKIGEVQEVKLAYNYMKDKGQGDLFIHTKGANGLVPNKEKGIEPEEEAAKEVRGMVNFHFSEKTVKDLMDAYKAFRKVSPDTNEMTAFTNAQKALRDAVASKNMDKIREAKTKFEEVSKGYDEVFKKLTLASPDSRYQCNLSYARNANYPARFRNDITGASRFREFSYMLEACQTAGVSFEAFLKSPMAAIRKIGAAVVEKNPLNNWLKNENTSELINSFASTAFLEDNRFGDYSHTTAQGAPIGFGMLTTYCDLKDYKDMCAFRTFYNLTAAGPFMKQPAGLATLENDTNAKIIATITALEPKDRNIYDIFTERLYNPETIQVPKEFSLEEYLKSGRTTPEDVIMRMADVLVHLTDNTLNVREEAILQGCQQNLAVIQQTKNMEYSDTAAKIVNAIIEGDKDAITETDLKIFRAETAYKKDYQKDIIAKDANVHINNLATMKADYSSRPFYKRWFALWGETARLRSAINDMQDKLTDYISEAELKNKLQTVKENGPLPEEKFSEKTGNEALDTMKEVSRWPVDIETGEAQPEFNNDFVDEDTHALMEKSVNEKDYMDDPDLSNIQ